MLKTMIGFLEKAYLKILKLWWKVIVPIRLASKGVKIGKGVVFYGMPIVSLFQDSNIQIGDRVVLCSDSRYTALGVNHPVVLRTLRAGAEISIGKDTGISGACICAAERVEIGRNCLIGANSIITDTDFHAIKPNGRRYNTNPTDIQSRRVKISDNVFLGVNSVLLKGSLIGKNSVIGACSIVNVAVPDNQIWGGHPAKLLNRIKN